MAYGNNNLTQQKNGYETTVYSNYRMNNAESRIDPTCITFRFWKSNLCIGIHPLKETNNGEISFDMDGGATIYLSHTKAKILKAEIENFLRSPDTYNGSGVSSNNSIITISNGSEYGKNAPIITIRRVNENGDVEFSFAYEFKREYHYSIRGYFGNKDFEKEFDDYQDIEIRQLVTLLDEYCKSSTNAVAFSIMNQRQYSVSRIENKIDTIANSLGVELPKGGNSNRSYSNNSYFNNNSGRNANNNGTSGYSSGVSFESATIDCLDD